MMWGYSVLLGLGLAVSSPWWLLRLTMTPRFRRGLGQRLGRVPAPVYQIAATHRVVWLHAVSVGELLAAAPLVQALEAALNRANTQPPWCVVVSTTTEAGQMVARERFGADRVFHNPLDLRWPVRTWLRALQPALLLLVESELWPRLLHECARRAVPVVVVNARMSDRSFRRASRLRSLWGPVLRKVRLFLPRDRETANRLEQLGVPASRLAGVGNLKYDLAPDLRPMVETLRPLVERNLLVVAGSLAAPEEDLLLAEWERVQRAVPAALLLLAPRHPERFKEVGENIAARALLYRASQLQDVSTTTERPRHLPRSAMLLLDTVGDLASVYSLAEVAFVGGSLNGKGGHNPLEPARFGVPVLMGPSFENFREVVAEMQTAQGIVIVHSAQELGDTLIRLLADRVEADALGQRGFQAFALQRGATARTVEVLLPLLLPTVAPAGEAL